MRKPTNNYTVEGLVAKYRNFVKKNSPHSVDDTWTRVDENGNIQSGDVIGYFDPIDASADQQLLAVLYYNYAGGNADNKVVDALSCFASKFHHEAISDDELSFLIQHFQDVVLYEFSNLHKWASAPSSLLWYRPISEKRFAKLKDYFSLPDNGTVYIADANICDIAISFPGYSIKGYTGGINRLSSEDSRQITWALGQIRLFALNIHSEIEPIGEEALNMNSFPEPGSVDIVIFDPLILLKDGFEIEKLYNLLKDNGKMIVSTGHHDLIKKDSIITRFLCHMAEKKRISAIISLKLKDEFADGSYSDNILFCLDKKEQPEFFVESGSHHASIDVSKIDPTFLWPEYYLVERPKDGVSLSSIVRLYNTSREMMKHPRSEYDVESNKRKRINEDYLSDEMLFAGGHALSANYADANLCSKQLIPVNDKRFDRQIDDFDVLDTWRDRLCKIYQPGVTFHVVDETLFVGYINENPKDKYVVFSHQAYLIPKRGIDVRYIASVLLSEEVRDQVVLLSSFGNIYQTMSIVLDRIIVPKHSSKERLQFLADSNYQALLSVQKELKKNHEDYKKAVRMRKHALTQKLSTFKEKFSKLNSFRERNGGHLNDEDVLSRITGSRVKDAFEFLSTIIKEIMPVIEHIADVDYSFKQPERINIKSFIENYIAQNMSATLNFKPIISWKDVFSQFYNKIFYRTSESTDDYIKIIRNLRNTYVHAKELSDTSYTDSIISSFNMLYKDRLRDYYAILLNYLQKYTEAYYSIWFPKDALTLIINNIVSNAMEHAFTDESRTDYKLRFSVLNNGSELSLIIENNGTPIPEDRDVASLLEYGVSSSLHQNGHNGIGCNEIDDIMRRYNGKVVIESTPDEEFTVKYILTFNSIIESEYESNALFENLNSIIQNLQFRNDK